MMQTPFAKLDSSAWRAESRPIPAKAKPAVINTPTYTPVDKAAAMLLRRATWLEMPPPVQPKTTPEPAGDVAALREELRKCRKANSKLATKCHRCESENAALLREIEKLNTKFLNLSETIRDL